jgi:hypothetical protein
MMRMSRRSWLGQSFGEGLGQIWNFQEHQGFVEDPMLHGFRLNVLITVVVAGDIAFWIFGFITIIVSESSLCADKLTEDASIVLAYQFFNVFFFSAYLDIVMPYFNLEFDPDVDLMQAGVKNSSGDMKRKMKNAMEKKARDAKRLKERMRKRAGQPKVIQVAPSSTSRGMTTVVGEGGSSSVRGEGGSIDRGGRGPSKGTSSGSEGERPETAWWAAENGIPPRKAIVTNKVMPEGPETNDEKKKSKGKQNGKQNAKKNKGKEAKL